MVLMDPDSQLSLFADRTCDELVLTGASPSVYVDDAIHPWRGRKWAHLFCEDLDRLHEFAVRLGLKRAWFQLPPKASWPHYDVTDTMRLKALRMGAVAVDRKEFVLIARRILRSYTASRQAHHPAS